MNKYKVGDKIVLTVSDVNEKAYYSYYVFNNNDLILWEPSTDKYAEPLSNYTEPLEAKIRRQAAEITRLLAENKELKEDFEKSKRVNLNMGRLAGQNEAWELARKIFDMETNDIEDIFIEEDAWNLGTVLNNYTYQEAAAKVAEWEKTKEEIKRGDIIRNKYSTSSKFCVTDIGCDGHLYGVGRYGLTYSNKNPEDWEKTGRHIDIDSFLKQIGEEQE